MVVLASAPHMGFLLNGFSPHWKSATLSVTGRVTPIIVSSPSTPVRRSPSKRIAVDLKFIVGYLATLK